jgi:hypothetical protein
MQSMQVANKETGTAIGIIGSTSCEKGNGDITLSGIIGSATKKSLQCAAGMAIGIIDSLVKDNNLVVSLVTN